MLNCPSFTPAPWILTYIILVISKDDVLCSFPPGPNSWKLTGLRDCLEEHKILKFGLGWEMVLLQSAPLSVQSNATVTECVLVPSSCSLGDSVFDLSPSGLCMFLWPSSLLTHL